MRDMSGLCLFRFTNSGQPKPFLAGAKRAALYVGWSQDQEQAPPAPNTKLSITRSFLELQSPDFAWKFV